jgi:glycosyltransferase involved in cell wall biosynthesis
VTFQSIPAQIGFLVKTFPKLSETFILEEILGLERLGVALHIFSLNPARDEAVHSAFDQIRANVTYLPAAATLRGRAAAQITLALSNPFRYAKALWFALRRSEGHKLKDFLRAGDLSDKLRRVGISHLHAHFISEPAGIAELASILTGIPHSISAHAKDIYLSQPQTLRRKLRRAKFTVTCTCYNRTHMTAIAPTANIHRMYHGIDIERFSTAGQMIKNTPPLILSVGRLREKKGFVTLIKSCLELHLAGIDFRCEVVGYGEDHEKLQRLIDSYGLQSVICLTGKMTHTELIERYRRATLFVLPSQIAEDGDRDGIPNVLLEAMAMELPVVSTAVSGIPEVIKHGINGLLVPPQDVSELTRAIVAVLGDPELCARMGKAGREVVETMFCNERNLLLLRDLFGSVLRGSNPVSNSRVPEEYLHANY